VLADKLNDMLPQLISNAANTVTMFFRRIRERGNFKMPLVPPDGSRKNRASPLLLTIAQRNNKSEALAEVGGHSLGLMTGNIDTQLAHGCDRIGIERCCPRAGDLEPVSRQVAEECLGQLSSARIPGAEKEHIWLNHGDWPLLAKGDDLVGLNSLVSSATFRIEKTEQLLQGFDVGGVPEEGAVASDLDQILVLEFFQMTPKASPGTGAPLVGLPGCSWSKPYAGYGSLSAMGEGVLLQLKSAKQLSVGGYDDGGQAHRDRPHTHREIESPVDEKAGSDRDSDDVIRRRPNQILDHFSIGSAG